MYLYEGSPSSVTGYARGPGFDCRRELILLLLCLATSYPWKLCSWTQRAAVWRPFLVPVREITNFILFHLTLFRHSPSSAMDTSSLSLKCTPRISITDENNKLLGPPGGCASTTFDPVNLFDQKVRKCFRLYFWTMSKIQVSVERGVNVQKP